MTRHGKNCTAGAVYTYHEKKKDTAASGYGTQNVRLSRDAVKDFDCCCLSLQPCKDPVVTPDGYLYEKEAILEYILHQKKEIARQMKDRCVYCPMSGRPLKLKDLTPVCFTLLDPAVGRVGLINRQDRYVCAVTRDMLGNSVPCALLRPS
ncbi:Nitric oxide synthase-interacting protein [Chelonia mydas]|uniref:Nitric oxide synthase-interacting protein n=1 Tax=Chelonia mydas TaxID=8469 RepID=M7BVH6_CHEMY|nr:Nitric oxide synthase-interacting protein [Chelonia mydas]